MTLGRQSPHFSRVDRGERHVPPSSTTSAPTSERLSTRKKRPAISSRAARSVSAAALPRNMLFAIYLRRAAEVNGTSFHKIVILFDRPREDGKLAYRCQGLVKPTTLLGPGASLPCRRWKWTHQEYVCTALDSAQWRYQLGQNSQIGAGTTSEKRKTPDSPVGELQGRTSDAQKVH